MSVLIYEFGRNPELRHPLSLDEACKLMDDNYHLNIIAEISPNEIYFWQPDHHEFSVIYGSKSLIAQIKVSGIFDYSFEDYKSEEFFSDKSKENLAAYERKYDFI